MFEVSRGEIVVAVVSKGSYQSCLWKEMEQDERPGPTITIDPIFEVHEVILSPAWPYRSLRIFLPAAERCSSSIRNSDDGS
jgi:hypothetical protein